MSPTPLLSAVLAVQLFLSPFSSIALAHGGVDDDDGPAAAIDDWADGEFHTGGTIFVLNHRGHPVLQGSDGGWLCRWFGWFCPSVEAGAMTVTMDDAKNLVVGKVIPDLKAEMRKAVGRELPMFAFAWPTPLPRGTAIYDHNPENPPINVLSDSWFVFIDLDPYAEFGHRAEFVLIDGKTGTVARQRVFGPPVFKDEIYYQSRHDRWNTPDRFYPVSLENLPEPGSWPLVPASKTVDDAPARPGKLSFESGLHEDRIALSVIPHALAQDAAVDCKDKIAKKVGVVISGETQDHVKGKREDGKDFLYDRTNASTMLKNLGFAPKDIHGYDPGTHPKLKDVWEEIKKLTRDLGPCDKFFFYVTGHGLITDENRDGVPDTPSSGIGYGRGENEAKIGKTRWSEFSIIRLLEEIKAGHINLMLDSCFSGSMQTLMADHAANPQAGSTWNVFLASTRDKPSYSITDRPGGEYTDAMTYCVSLKLVERGIQNPTIEQMEEIFKECQNELVKNAHKFLEPLPPITAGHFTLRVEPDTIDTKEGDDGTHEVTITIYKEPVDRDLTVEYSTFLPEDPRTASAMHGLDFDRIENGSIKISAGQNSVTIRIVIRGDRKPEEDELFYVWFPSLQKIVSVRILDDDRPPSSSSSSISSASAASSEPGYDLTGGGTEGVTVTIDGGYTMGGKLGLPKDYSFGDFTIGYTVKCPTCDDLKKQVEKKQAECASLDAAAQAADASIADADARIKDAEKSLKDAEKRLKDFSNPKSYAESNGRRVTSSDLEIQRTHDRSLWNKYRNGEMTAQELSDAWKKGLTNEERNQLKKEKEKELSDIVEAAKAKVKAAQEAREAAVTAAAVAKAEAGECHAQLEALKKELEECEKRCVDEGNEGKEGSDGNKELSSESSSSLSSSSITSLTSSLPSLPSSSSLPGRSSMPSTSSVRTVNGTTSSATTTTPPISSSKSSSSLPSLPSSSSLPSSLQCPSGKTSDKDECEDFCDHEGGVCEKDSTGCYSCKVYACPSGTTDTCPTNCANGCDKVSEQGNKSCYVCKQSCEELCAKNGFTRVGTDWTAYMQEYLTAYTCVSGASAALPTGTIGSCSCSNQPQITVDQTVPVCKGTSCGDVACGQSATCQEGNTTVTVSCVWKGWQPFGVNQLRPVIGQ